MRLKDTAILSVLSRGLTTALMLLVVVITARMYGRVGRGDISIFTADYTFILHFCSVVGGGTIIYLYHKISPRQILLWSYLWTVVVCIIALIIFKTFYTHDDEFIFLIVAVTFATAISQIHNYLLLADQRIVVFSIMQVSQVALLLLLLVIELYYRSGTPSIRCYMYFAIASMILSAVVSYIFIHPWLRQSGAMTIDSLRVMLHYGMQSQLSNILQFVCYRATFYWLEYFSMRDALGLFALAVMIGESVWLISSSIAMVQYAKIAQTTSDKLSRIYTDTLRVWVLMATLVALTMVVLLPEDVWIFIFDYEFAGVKNILWLLAPGILALSVSRMHTHYFIGKGDYYLNNYSSLLGAILATVSGYFCVRYWAAAGAAISMSITYTIVLLFTYWQYKKR